MLTILARPGQFFCSRRVLTDGNSTPRKSQLLKKSWFSASKWTGNHSAHYQV